MIFNRIGLIGKGMAMGIAEAIPGVSGGTIAFITGIYEELINTIKSITPQNLSLVFRDRKEFWSAVNGQFVLLLMTGMVIGLGIGITAIAHIMETNKESLWAFFFGIILASSIYFGGKVEWSVRGGIVFLLFAVGTFFITRFSPASGSDSLVYAFLSGCLAISALLLPGISGSFILLLLGMYHLIITELRNMLQMEFSDKSLVVIVFVLGLLAGLFSFARVISYLFKRYTNMTMIAMTGILLGSLNKLWPWKKITKLFDKSTGQTFTGNLSDIADYSNFKILNEANVLPAEYSSIAEPKIMLVLGSFFLGLAVVYFLTKSEKSKAIS